MSFNHFNEFLNEKKEKTFDLEKQKNLIDRLEFSLTRDQNNTLEEINNDLSSTTKMFRLLQGDVGSGKTIVALCAAANVVKSSFQVAVMTPTEILAKQHFDLAKSISKNLNSQLIKAEVKRFSDMEVFVEVQENVRGEDMFVIQSTSYPANDNLMELLVSLDALRRASARRITAVIPYYGYARQDRKSGPRTPISAKLVANLITKAGADRILTMDLHAGQIQGFFDIPTDNLFAAPVFVKDLEEKYEGKPLVIVSPDVGGVVRARAIARRINANLAIIDKRREKAGSSEVMNIIGDVKNHHCIIVDDIIDSGGTICNAAQALIDVGALSVDSYVTHGVLSGSAVTNISNSRLNCLVTTDSIKATEAVKMTSNIRQISIAPIIGEAIRRVHMEQSVSSLFE